MDDSYPVKADISILISEKEPNKMKFVILSPLGAPVLQTEYPECIPELEDLRHMKQSGYKFKLDSKLVTIQQIKTAFFEHEK